MWRKRTEERRKRMRKLRSALSLIMSFSLLFSIKDLYVLAEETEEGETAEVITETVEEPEETAETEEENYTVQEPETIIEEELPEETAEEEIPEEVPEEEITEEEPVQEEELPVLEEIGFRLEAKVMDYGEAVYKIIMDLHDSSIDISSLNKYLFTITADGIAEDGRIVYENAERAVDFMAVNEDVIELYLYNAYGNTGEMTVLDRKYLHVNYHISFNDTIRLKEDGTAAPQQFVFAQEGAYTDQETERFVYKEYGGMPYRLYTPQEDGNDHPLIVWMHGADGSGNNNELPLLTDRCSLGFAGEEAQQIFNGAYVAVPQSNSSWKEDDLHKVMHLIGYLENTCHIDRTRISIAGSSLGGSAALRLAVLYPDTFASVTAVCPSLPEGTYDESRFRDALYYQPVFLIHALNDEVVDYGSSEHLKEILPYAQFARFDSVNVNDVEYPGHECRIYLAGNMVSAEDGRSIWQWMAEQNSTRNVYRLEGRSDVPLSVSSAEYVRTLTNTEKYDTAVIAGERNLADALSGIYLASKKNGQLLTVNEQTAETVRMYIRTHVKEGGTVYILGGEEAVPMTLESGLPEFEVVRIAGKDRYETNVKVLKEAGVDGNELLIATGRDYADGLCAAASGKPVLFADAEMLPMHRYFLNKTHIRKFYILGGELAVSRQTEEAFAYYGDVERISGEEREETSLKVAERFFSDRDEAVAAFSGSFNEGLSGVAVALTLKAPLLLTSEKKTEETAAYTEAHGIRKGYVLGSADLISDQAAFRIFDTEAFGIIK